MKELSSYMLVGGAILLVSGCAVLNPYKSDFTCPQKENGKCVAVEAAYDESLKKAPEKKAPEAPRKSQKAEISTTGPKSAGSDLVYQEEVYKKLIGLLREPVTPLVAPPKIMRVLFLPYKGEGGELFMPRYVYFMADDPRWIMGDYLEKGATD